MKVAEAVQHMTKSYLHRILDSFTKDVAAERHTIRQAMIKRTELLTLPTA
ncbi:MAG: hypothetical protein WD960_09130 [Gemmatimonadota bacterium]